MSGNVVFDNILGEEKTLLLGCIASTYTLGVLLLKDTTIQADTTLQTYSHVSDLLNGTNHECDATGYQRVLIPAGNITSVVDTTNHRWDGPISANVAFTGVLAGNTLVRAVWYVDLLAAVASNRTNENQRRLYRLQGINKLTDGNEFDLGNPPEPIRINNDAVS